MDFSKTIDKLINSNIRVVSGNEMPHPSSIIDVMKEFGNIKMAKLSGKIDGLDDKLNEIQLINNYLIEVQVDNEDEFYGTLGLIVQQGSDKVKVYSGLTAHACLNLSVFGADYVKDLKGIEIEFLKGFLDKAHKNLPKQIDVIQSNVDRLKNNPYDVGKWVWRKGEMLSSMPTNLLSYLVYAEEQLREPKSVYYDQPCTDWTLLSAMTDKIKNEGISSRVNKTLQLERLFL